MLALLLVLTTPRVCLTSAFGLDCTDTEELMARDEEMDISAPAQPWLFARFSTAPRCTQCGSRFHTEAAHTVKTAADMLPTEWPARDRPADP